MTFHSTEEMLLRSRKRIQHELMLSRTRAADVLGTKERHLEQRMLSVQANSAKRYTELHDLYTHAVDLRDRYHLTVNMPRPVMTTQEEYEETRRRVGVNNNNNSRSIEGCDGEHLVDLSKASDADLERYRHWLKAKTIRTSRSMEGPNVY